MDVPEPLKWLRIDEQPFLSIQRYEIADRVSKLVPALEPCRLFVGCRLHIYSNGHFLAMRKGPLMLVPLGEASRLTRVNKSTLTRAIKAGRLSATRREDGSFVVDVSELERIYPIRPASDASSASTE